MFCRKLGSWVFKVPGQLLKDCLNLRFHIAFDRDLYVWSMFHQRKADPLSDVFSVTVGEFNFLSQPVFFFWVQWRPRQRRVRFRLLCEFSEGEEVGLITFYLRVQVDSLELGGEACCRIKSGGVPEFLASQLGVQQGQLCFGEVVNLTVNDSLNAGTQRVRYLVRHVSFQTDSSEHRGSGTASAHARSAAVCAR